MGRILDYFLEIIEDDFSHPSGSATQIRTELETAHMTPQDQSALVGIFNDIYSKIDQINQTIVNLQSASGVSTSQLNAAVASAVAELPAFDATAVTGYKPAASQVDQSTTETNTASTGQPAETAAVTDTASAEVVASDPAASDPAAGQAPSPPPAPSASPYLAS